jgi:hypothetical protein
MIFDPCRRRIPLPTDERQRTFAVLNREKTMKRSSVLDSLRQIGAVFVIAACEFVSACGGAAGAGSDLAHGLTPATYRVGGTVTSLSGTGLVLQDNGGDDLAISADGSFQFPTALPSGSAYSVSVKTQPTNPPQTCVLSNASGTVGTANVGNVAADCSLAAASTAVGTPVGTASSQSIAAGGGSITSPDGRLTVTVPAGAVTAATTFTIQPITNQSPGAVGMAYRLGPEGLTFATSVEIRFHYSNQDLAGTVADAFVIASQTAQGYWQVSTAMLDTTSQTMSVQATHFSDWSLLAGAQLQPADASVQVGQTVALTLVYCQRITTSDLLTTLLAKCAATEGAGWAVNSVAGGNATSGTVAASGASTATYSAPATPPAANPVAVSASTLLQPLSSRETLVSNITVLPDCSAPSANCVWTGTATYNASNGSAVATQVTWNVSSSQDGVVTLTAVSGTFTFSPQPGCSMSPTTVPLTAANAEDAALGENSNMVISLPANPPQYYGLGFVTAGQVTQTCGTFSEPWPDQTWLNTGTAPLLQNASPNATTLQGSYTDITGDKWSWNFQRTQ